MKTLALNLTLDEINQILDALGQQPFVRVHQLITKIQQQATHQLEVQDTQMAQPTPPKGES